MDPTAHHGRPLGLGLLVLALALGFGLEATRPSVWVLDAYQRWWPRTVAELPITIVAVDEASLRAHGQWPWPRTLTAELLERVGSYAPIAVGIDIIMPEPDGLSPESLLSHHPDAAPELLALVRRLASNDSVLGRAISDDLPVVLGNAGTAVAVEGAETLVLTPYRIEGPGSMGAVPAYAAVQRSIPELEDGAAGHGLLNVIPDGDGVVRRIPLLGQVGEDLYPSLALELLRVAQGATWFSAVTDEGGLRAVRTGGLTVSTARDATVPLRFSPSDARRYVSARDVLAGDAEPSMLRQKIVLVGVTALGLTDAPPTPIAPRMNGVEVQAQLLENIIYGTALRRPSAAVALELAAGGLAGLVMIWAVPALGGLASGAVLLVLLGLIGAASASAFAHAGAMLGLLFPSGCVVLVFVTLLSTRVLASERTRRRLERELAEERLASARVAGELDAARDIQRGILPDAGRFELPAGCTMHAYLAAASEVGGDLYDIVRLVDGRLLLLLGDVSGKGVPASLFMAVSKTLCKSTALRAGAGAGEILSTANREISRENPAQLFVTAVAVIIDPADGTLELSIAGHESPFVACPGAPPRRLHQSGGPPLCATDDFEYASTRGRIDPGETLVMVTDGVTEALDHDGRFYGSRRLATLLARVTPEEDAATVVERVRSDVERFAGGTAPSDDIAILAFGRAAPAAGAASSAAVGRAPIR